MTDQDGQEPEQAWAPLADVAAAYGVSIDTIRRRMKRGELEARRQQTPQGFKWLALMPDAREPAPPEPSHDALGSSQTADATVPGVQVVEREREDLVETLRHELALRNREIARLHEVLASQAKAIAQTAAALPATSLEAPGSTETSETGARGLLDRMRRWLSR